ncbi:MAG: sulfatase, partial [Acidobacteriota bacterium]
MSTETSTSRESFLLRLLRWWLNAGIFFTVEVISAVDPGGAEPAWLLLTALAGYLAVATVGAGLWHLVGGLPGLRRISDSAVAYAPGAVLLLTKLPGALGEGSRLWPFLGWLAAIGLVLAATRLSKGDRGGLVLDAATAAAVWIPALRIEHAARVAETHSSQVVISAGLAGFLAFAAAAWALLLLFGDRLGLPRAAAVWGGGLALGALALFRLAAPSPFELGLDEATERVGRGTPVILLVLDTVRADHLSLYGYPRNTTPNLDAFARDAVVYERAVATSSWTLPSHASLFTGLFPLTHGALRLPGLDAEKASLAEKGIHRPAYPLPAETPTLAEHLQQEGFATAAMVANFAYLDPVFGVDRGFETYFNVRNTPIKPMILRLVDRRIRTLPWARRHWQVYRSAEQINRLGVEWLEAQGTHRLFLFLNYMEAHLPWGPHQPGLRYAEFAAESSLPERPRGTATPGPEWKERVDLYDSNIASLDARLGELFDDLKRLELYDRSLIVVISDHGESFGENGADGHGKSLNEAEIWVPMLVKYPGARDVGRRSERVQLVDVVPMITAELQRPFPARIDGRMEPDASEEPAETADGDAESVAGPDGAPWLRLAEMYGDPTDKTGAFAGYQVALYDGERKLVIREDGEIFFSTSAGGFENPLPVPASLV